MLDAREIYESLWGDSLYPRYRKFTVAENDGLLQFFLSHVGPNDSVNDYGCGSGRPAQKIWKAGHRVAMIDIAENCLDPAIREMLVDGFSFIRADLRKMGPNIPCSDWGFCCDVMEHIPQDSIDQVLQGIAQRSSHCFFQIANWQDTTGPKLFGEYLHCTVLGEDEWKERLHTAFFQVESIYGHLCEEYLGYQFICST
jgi:SAM-dependent methyltransferase